MKDHYNKDVELAKWRQYRIAELERKTALQQKIGELNTRLAAIVEHSNDAIIGKDLNGVITSWNRGAEIIYGYTAEEAIGRPTSMLVPSGNSDEIPIILDKIKRGESIENYETTRIGKDGKQVYVSISASPMKNVKDEIIGASTIARDITKRKQLEEQLRKSEERLSLALEASNDGVWDWKINDETYLSPKYYEMTGYAVNEIRPDLDFYKSLIHPDDRQRVMKTMEEHMEGLTEQSIVEYRMITKCGECKHILGKGKVIERDENGKPVRMIGTISDITERKKAEEQIRMAKEEWEQTFDAMPDIVAVIDNEHVIRRANKALAARLGIDRDELIGEKCYTAMCGIEKPRSNCPGSMTVFTGNDQFEERFVDKLHGYYLISCTAIAACDGSTTCFVEVCRDISRRKQAEEEIRLHSEILNNMAEGVLLTRKEDGVIVYANPTFEHMFRYDGGELVGKHVSIVNAPSPKDPAEIAKEIIETLLVKGVWQGEVLNIRKDGSIFWCFANVSTFEHSQYGNVWISVQQDINERKLAEFKLRDTLAEAQRFREALDSVSSYVYMKNTQSRYVYANRLTLELFGCSSKELVGCDDTCFFPPETVNRLREIDSRVFAGEKTVEEIDVSDARTGRRVYWEIKTPIYADEERKTIWGLLGISTDITERKKMAEEKEKLIGELKEALANIKTLSGMLPICSYCKKIRDDKGYWEEVASYITNHSDVLFSHGICPDCAKKVYEEFKKERGT